MRNESSANIRATRAGATLVELIQFMRSKYFAGSTFWLYRLLALLFAVSMISQVPFTLDLIRAWSGGYPRRPIEVDSPWPTITEVSPQALSAGLRVGDHVAAIDGRTPRGISDLEQPLRLRRPGDTLPVSVLRDGRVVVFRPTLVPVLLDRGLAVTTFILLPWFCIALGFWLVFMRPHDPMAWITFGILLGLGQLYRPNSLDALGWPAWVGAITVAFRQCIVFVWAVCMMLFGFLFPKPSRLENKFPRLKWAVAVPLVVMGLWEAARGVAFGYDYAATGRWLRPNPLPDWAVETLLYCTISLFFAGLGEKYHNPSLGKDDQRRLRLIYWGCTVAMAPSVLVLLDRHSTAAVWAMMAMILMPITLAYVIVVERAMDVRMVVRQGVQYALARRGVRVLQAVLTIAIVFGSSSILNSTRLSRANQITLIAVGVVLVLRIRDMGERVRRWVDRRFFREAYNAEKILSELSEQVRGILDRDALLETVARRISESLHVDRIAVLLRQNGAFRPAMALGYPVPPAIEFAADSAAVSAMRERREPIAVEEKSLPALGAELLLPLSSARDLLGFISLGPKRSEEPYTPSDTSLLRTVAAQTGLALENSRLSEAIAAEVAQRELLNREIEIAREVQQRLFPQSLPEVAALTYAGYCRPARGVGGDYYDFLALSGGRLGLAIGDVSGKGVPAALLMASLQASVRGQSQAEAGHVSELMTNVNRLVCDATPDNRYATFFYAQFDPGTRKLVYTNGGHNPPMLLRGSEVLRLEAGGPPVGLFRLSPYVQAETQLLAGDVLVFYTDGVSEAENPAEEEWGEEALIEAVRACAGQPPCERIARIIQAADAFSAGAPQHDDMTLVIAEVLA